MLLIGFWLKPEKKDFSQRAIGYVQHKTHTEATGGGTGDIEYLAVNHLV